MYTPEDKTDVFSFIKFYNTIQCLQILSFICESNSMALEIFKNMNLLNNVNAII